VSSSSARRLPGLACPPIPALKSIALDGRGDPRARYEHAIRDGNIFDKNGRETGFAIAIDWLWC
jgi:hypothetical protein